MLNRFQTSVILHSSRTVPGFRQALVLLMALIMESTAGLPLLANDSSVYNLPELMHSTGQMYPRENGMDTETSAPATTQLASYADLHAEHGSLLSFNALMAETDYQKSGNMTSVFRRRRSIIREQTLGIGANLLGATLGYASVYLQYSIGKVFQMEAGVDLTTVYSGVTLFPEVLHRVESIKPYMGLMIGYSDPARNNIAKGIYAYMPVGIRFLTPDDWYVCAEISATTASSVRTAPLFLGIKLGYLFKL